jgi:hypothetical protein
MTFGFDPTKQTLTYNSESPPDRPSNFYLLNVNNIKKLDDSLF